MSFVAELRRRNVIRVAVLYGVTTWLLLQIAETVLPIFATPTWVLQVLVVLLALGFIPTLVFSWVYELTPEGLKRERDVDRAQSIVGQTARKLDAAVIVLLLAVAAMVLFKPVPRPVASAAVVPTLTDGTVPAAGADAGGLGATSALEPSNSIAVLPFVNMSSDPEQVYFSDGITEELLNALVKLPDLKVAGRTSSFAFRDKTGDLREIGRALNVNHILEGSVRKQGARIRITAQLVTAEDGFHLWSETYDREAGDIFALQDEITAAIVEALKVKLGTAPLTSTAPIDLKAYELYLKARQQLALRGVTALESARKLFGQSLGIAPDYAPAHAGLARTVTLLWTYAAFDVNRDQIITLIDAQRTAGFSARRALVLDPDQAEAWSVLGYVAYQLGGDMALAEQATTRSLALRPRDPEIVNFAGDFYFWTLDPRAEATERLAAALDPLQAANHYDLARLLVRERRFAEALESAENARALGFYARSPALLNDTLVPALVGLNRPGDAEALIRAARQSDSLTKEMADYLRIQVLVAGGQLAAASALIDGLLAAPAKARLPEFLLTDALIRTGRYDEATQWLARAIAVDGLLVADPMFLPLPELLPPHPGLRAALDRPEYQSLFELRRRNLRNSPQRAP